MQEAEECILEPGGTFVVRGKEPSLFERRHNELLARLERLSAEIRELRGQHPLHGPGGSPAART